MREMKAFASLSSGLLARKGAARPAMRPQLFGQAPATAPAPTEDAGWNDCGWNDMGEGAPAPAEPVRLALAGDAEPSAGPPPVLRQQAEIAREFAPEIAETELEPVPRLSVAGRRVAFTLRLDPDRHLHLRLAAVAEHRSAQQIVTQALDELLARMPDAERLAATLAAGPAERDGA